MAAGRLIVVGGNRVTLIRIFLAAALAFYGFAAQAQVLPKIKEFYFDSDTVTVRKIIVVQGEGEALTAQLVKMRERGRKSLEATAQLAHVAMAGDRAELGNTLYKEAVQLSQLNSNLGRAIRWNYGWDLYRHGEAAQALTVWGELAGGFGEPAWVPPTLALGLWSADRKADAVKWYAAAMRTEPNLWNNPANFAALLPDWREEDRKRLAEVYAAWTADPPAWP
jgi:hypothetical protein